MHERLKWTLSFLFVVFWLHCTSSAGTEAKESTNDISSKTTVALPRHRRSPPRNVFLGMRGKKEALWDGCNDENSVEGDQDVLLSDDTQKLLASGQAETVDSPSSSRFLLQDRPFFGIKRVTGFTAMRGKKDPFDAMEMRKTQRLDSELRNFLEDKRNKNLGFTPMRGKKDENENENRQRVRRPESKFFAMRGRRSKRRAENEDLILRAKKWLCSRKREEESANMEPQNKEEGSQPSM